MYNIINIIIIDNIIKITVFILVYFKVVSGELNSLSA
jgi:hypothetical protein